MQYISDGNSVCGDVVLDSFKLVYTIHWVMKTAFKNTNMKSESFGIFIITFLNKIIIEEYAYFKKYST